MCSLADATVPMDSAMFSDLPGIDPDFDSTMHGPYREQSIRYPYDVRVLKGAPRSHGPPTSSFPNSYPSYMQFPMIVPASGCDGSRYWSSAIPNQDPDCHWPPSTQDHPLQPEKHNFWVGRAHIRTHASPSPSSASEDGSHPAPSQWNVEPTVKDAFSYPVHQLPMTPISPVSSPGESGYANVEYASYPIAASGGYVANYPGSGIKMEDIQQYPDSCAGDHFGDSNDPDSQATTFGTIDVKQESCPDPEDHALTPDGGTGHSDYVKEGSVEEEERDDTSDYSPKSRKKPKTARRLRAKSNRHAATRITGKSSASNRAAKRPHKNSCVSEAVPHASSRIACPHCSQSVHSRASLNKHIATVHTRPFTCTFREYGCLSTFGSKNEWKRHVSSQHLRTGYWRCRLERCYPQFSSDGSGEEEELIFNDFNRKDLFMQHLRRMHAPHISSSAADKAAFNASLDNIATECFNAVRGTPPRSTCGYCVTGEGKEQVFQGTGCWEARMEHVGRHLESGHGEERAWTKDCDLEHWLIKEGLLENTDGRGWRLVGLQTDDRSTRR